MRSKFLALAIGVTSILFATSATATDPVQEQLRLMEQRMAEMEDRLQATSDELNTAKATVEEQQSLLTSAGMTEVGDDGFRSGVASFFEEVDISGVVAASYNHRVLGPDDDQVISGNSGYFRHPNSNAFVLDQAWIIIDKPATEESRGGMHIETFAGQSTQSQNSDSPSGGSSNDPTQFGFELYTAYASYLAPVGDGVQFDAGLLATPLGAEVIQTNQNFNITQGLVFGLQPVTHVGVAMSTQLTDEIGFTAGVVNDVYNETNFDVSNGKAGYAQISFAGESFGMNVGAIVGSDEGSGACAFTDADDECNTSVFDVVLTTDPTENLSLWANFDWVRHFGDSSIDGDAFGVSGAGRIAITDTMGFASRVEYVRAESSFNSSPGSPGALSEILSLTGTVDKRLTDNLVFRAEARWDRKLDDGPGGGSAIFVNGNNGADNGGSPGSTRENQVVLLGELFYEF